MVAGYFLNDTALQLVGYSFLFISGTVLLAGSVEYKIGENQQEVYQYGDNYSGYHWDYDSIPPVCNPNDMDCVKLFHVNRTIVYNYDNFSDATSHWVGVYLMIVSIIASAVTFTRLKEEDQP